MSRSTVVHGRRISIDTAELLFMIRRGTSPRNHYADICNGHDIYRTKRGVYFAYDDGDFTLISEEHARECAEDSVDADRYEAIFGAVEEA